MSDGQPPAPREQGWSHIVLALAAFLLLPHAPGLPAVVPVVDTYLLLVPMLTVFLILGWLAGGSLVLAVIWCLITAWVFVLPAPRDADTAYYALARGWALLVAGAFGIVCLAGRARPFFHRALSAVGFAILLAVLLVTFGRLDAGRAEHVIAAEYAARNAAAGVQMRALAGALAERAPSLDDAVRTFVGQRERDLQALSRIAAPLYPALLGLEALACCALAWALHHRLSRARLGPPLAPIRRFAFSDQLVWALVAGITMLVVPSLQALAVVGRNLVLFVGTLYALRGYGIYAWFISKRAAVTSVVVAVAIFPLSLVTVPAAVGLGLSDTWFDWRKRIGAKLSGSDGA